MANYTESQKNRLLKIPYSKGKGGSHVAKLQALAKKWKRSNETVWQTWKRLHTSSKTVSIRSTVKVQPIRIVSSRITPKKITAVAAGSGANITPYVLESGADITPRTAMDITKDRLRPVLEAMEVYNANGTRHTIPVNSSEAGSLRNWLTGDPELSKKGWSISTIPDNPKMSRIYRKS